MRSADNHPGAITHIDTIADNLRIWIGQPLNVWMEDVHAAAGVLHLNALVLAQRDQGAEGELETDADLGVVFRSGGPTLFFEEQTIEAVSASPYELHIHGHRLNTTFSKPSID